MEMMARMQAAQYGDGFFYRLDPRVKIGVVLLFALIGPLIEELIPMLIRSFKVADRMGAAAELRGLSAPANKLSLAELRLKNEDWLFLTANLTLMTTL
jgi:energy-coupling factor transporter transmembrane protein EcfT